MIIVVAPRIHHPAAMPEGRSPAAPIRMSVGCIEDEPTAFHFCVAQLQAAPARHLAFRKRKVHMLCRISMKIIDPQGAAAARETSCGKCIRPASCPASSVTSRGFEARTGTDSLFVVRTIGPNLVSPVEAVVSLPHPFDRRIGGNASRKIEPVIGWKQGPCTSSLPFVGVAEPFAHGLADKSRFPSADPDNRVDTGDIGKLELINAGLGVLGLFNSRVVEGRHVLCPADLFKRRIFIADGQLAELFPSSIRSHRVSDDCRIPLTDIARLTKEGSNRIQLFT
jgi:hypothetical protein